MSRIIGIRHRVKRTVEGESRPTQVVIMDEELNELAVHELDDEQMELCFVLGTFPVSFRTVGPEDSIAYVPDYHLKLKKIRKGQGVIEGHPRIIDKQLYVATKIADAFGGLRPSDRVAMALGGSGDYFAFALARRALEIGATVYRIAPAKLKGFRGDVSKDDDARLLAELLVRERSAFYELLPRDAEVIRIREAYRSRIDAMKARIACEQRMRSRFIGTIFCSSEGKFPEGAIEKAFDEAKANDAVLSALLREESNRERELERLVKGSDIWLNVMGGIEGLGWAIGSRIIASVVDIRRFNGSIMEATEDHPLIAESRSRQRELEEKIPHLCPATSSSNTARYQGFVAHHERLVQNSQSDRDELETLECILAEYATRQRIRTDARHVTRGKAKFKAFAGVHVLEDGRFPRRRAGSLANWSGDVRQALYLLGDQFNRRPSSYWGQKLLANKAHFRTIHPDVVIDEKKKKRYTDGHIHKMAIWRTLTQFAMWLYREWSRYENNPDQYVRDPYYPASRVAAQKAA